MLNIILQTEFKDDRLCVNFILILHDKDILVYQIYKNKLKIHLAFKYFSKMNNQNILTFDLTGNSKGGKSI